MISGPVPYKNAVASVHANMVTILNIGTDCDSRRNQLSSDDIEEGAGKMQQKKGSRDRKLDASTQSERSDLAQEIQEPQPLKLPKQIKFSKDKNLNISRDASQTSHEAIACAVEAEPTYIVFDKAKVAPKKSLIIPKLKLMAAILAARVAIYYLLLAICGTLLCIKETYNDLMIKETHFRSAPQVMLHCIHPIGKQIYSVQNRLEHINALIPNGNWHYVPTADVSADLLSREMTMRKFLESILWKGPEWLPFPTQWPQWEIPDKMNSKMNVAALQIAEVAGTEPMVDPEKYRGYFTLLKIFALVQRSTRNLRDQRLKQINTVSNRAVTRVYQYEFTVENTKDSSLHALTRFIGCRGISSYNQSNNKTVFLLSAEYLESVQCLPSVQEYLRDHQIVWRFIASRSPHLGAVCERLIGVVKLCLRYVFGGAIVTKPELETVIVQSEGCVGSRLLIRVSDDLMTGEVITPFKMLRGYDLTALPIPIEYLDAGTIIDQRETVNYNRLLKREPSKTSRTSLR